MLKNDRQQSKRNSTLRITLKHQEPYHLYCIVAAALGIYELVTMHNSKSELNKKFEKIHGQTLRF